jgi:hypothetical protein
MKDDIMLHIHGFQTTFNGYYPPETENDDWIHNPYNSTVPDFSSKGVEQYV